MAVSRRKFLVGTAATSALALGPLRVSARPQRRLRQSASSATPQAAPSSVVTALNRMGYGPRPGDVARVTTMGLNAYIEEQLNPAAIDDSACDTRITNARVRVKYGAGSGYPAVDELRPLNRLNDPLSTLWPLADYDNPLHYVERMRPWYDVRVATLLRMVYSKRQLLEVLVDFWHNHFNVSASSDVAISATFPIYDRDVIRKNALGNFRTLLGDVTKSTAMLYYLDNVSNKASGGQGGNENFARELFELHTLGADNYLKFYNDRRQIGADSDGNARGYIDDDIYEASRCFTGWTVANGHWEFADPKPDTGAFYYFANWHDDYPKTVLSPDGFTNFPRDQGNLVDGGKVLDLLSRHRGTARTICTKLCRRLIADNPPANVINAAVETWMANLAAPDQIKRVVRTILQSNEFQTTWGQKLKRPYEFLASYLRATNAELQNDPADSTKSSTWDNIFYYMGVAGQRIFEWPTPTGHPDKAEYWSSTNGMLWRWNIPFIFMQGWGGGIVMDIPGQTPSGLTCTQIVDFWVDRLCGFAIDSTTRTTLINFMRQTGRADRPPVPTTGVPDYGAAAAIIDRLNCLVQLIAISPDFNAR